MKVRRFEWGDATATASAIRRWATEGVPDMADAVDRIGQRVIAERDLALLELTARFDATERPPQSLRVDPAAIAGAPEQVDPRLRAAMEVAIANIRAVAAAQVSDEVSTVRLSQGQTVSLREVPVGIAGVYVPGGRAAYPSSLLMCAVPARVAGVERVVVVSPPGPDGEISTPVLAAAALCDVDEVYAVGGAQAVYALAYGTETVPEADVIVGPGNYWVQEAKRAVMGVVGIDSYAGPSELMVIAGHDTDPEWVALDLCAQAEHGPESPLVVVAVEEQVLDSVATATTRAATTRPSVCEAPLAIVQVPDLGDAIELANAFAPEHLELLEEDAALQADMVRTAGCVFVGRHGATAFGDYVAGSNHVLPTNRSGRFSGPLGPGTFRRRISSVEIGADAATALAPHADALARAEGFPVHGESAMIRSRP
ncbi:MAG TPA: histidinol dehydrogenase [Solirubrobacterales bacterium]|nr:histidinol dehydrogenase [Solirubrobacterales bacterium]